MLYTQCPYLVAKVSNFKESGCAFKITGNGIMLSLKGEKVGGIYSSKCKKQKTLGKTVDFMIFAVKDQTDKRVLLVEMSNHMHKLSDLVEKFENSLEHLQAICFCDKENIRDFKISLIITYKKLRIASELPVIRSKEIKFRGKKYRFYLNKCNEVFDLK